MPGSAVSGNSSSSSLTRRGRKTNYRTVSHQSNVDESLFGTPNHIKQRQEMLDQKWHSPDNSDMNIQRQAAERSANRRNRKNKHAGKETVQVITKDLIRNLIVPEEDPSGKSAVLSREEFFRIRQASKVLNKQEREHLFEMQRKDKEDSQDACADRKNYIKAKDLSRRKNEKLSELEEEAKENAEHLLAKASEMRQEQEDEIKHLNELILNAKCHAIRDAQILEKAQISGEMTEEEKRLDILMEVDRQNSIKIQEEIEKRRKEERYHGAVKILDQISENEQDRLFELERKDQENIQMQKYVEVMMDEDRASLEKKKAEQQALRGQLNQANDELLQRRDLKVRQEKAEEFKVVEYMKQKAERESAYEKEQEKTRIEKEKEVARLRDMQERVRDEQAEKDTLRAKRAQEVAEREWRKKEASEVLKKSEVEGMLIKARSEQMSQKEHFLAVQAQRDRAEFERVLQSQKELVEKDKREDVDTRKRRMAHAEDVRRQIRENEKLRIGDRNAFFEEGVRLDEEARLRQQKLDDVKQKKLRELRNAGIPEKYLAQVQRKINQPAHIST